MAGTDLFLWSRIKSGDKEAFQVLFANYYPLLCLLAKRYTNNMTDAKEVVQQLFISLWENKSRLTVSSSLKSYLFQAVKFNSIRYMQNHKKFDILVDNVPEYNNDPEFSDQVEFAELQARILKTIESLPEQCKLVFVLSRFEQLKHAEIGLQLNISLKTVEAHISKALKILHEVIDAE
jgi:RNA polymerase sigma-70 factor, ECF subfamily